MGTSQRHSPSVTGQPNWGKSSVSLTAAIKNLEKLEEIIPDNNNDQRSDLADQIQNLSQSMRYTYADKQTQKISNSFSRNVRNSVKRLIKASGGKKNVSVGKSRALGQAGIAVLGNFINTVLEIQQDGLDGWLKNKGITLEGKKREDIFNILIEACSDKVIGLDETAANQAITEMFEGLKDMMNETFSNIEETLQSILNDQQLQEIIDKFFGVYIFVHLSQNFTEKLEKKYTQEKVDQYMKQIKEQIISDIQEGIHGSKSINVDWNGVEGKKFISEEFNKILNIFDNDED
ncbi:hypothetical protein [Segatella baroniae]|nr:hypothetical protein [Segatella baroniae]